MGSIIPNVEEWGLILAVLAFVVGVYHLIEIRKVIHEARQQGAEARDHTDALKQQTEALQKQTENLEQVRQSLSTRYLGQFPQYYPNIVELLDRAKRDVLIFCDFPGYGSFTDHNTWIDYKQVLEKKMQQEELRVSLTCLDHERRKESLNEQLFGNVKDWEKWRDVALNREKLEVLLKSHAIKKDIKALSQQEFFDILEADEQRALKETFATAAEVNELDTYVPLHFWLIDGMSAIFAIPSSSAVEYGFSTTDQKLISAFIDLRSRYQDDYNVAVPAVPKGPQQG